MKAKIRKWFTYEKDRGMPEAILAKKVGLEAASARHCGRPPTVALGGALNQPTA